MTAIKQIQEELTTRQKQLELITNPDEKEYIRNQIKALEQKLRLAKTHTR